MNKTLIASLLVVATISIGYQTTRKPVYAASTSAVTVHPSDGTGQTVDQPGDAQGAKAYANHCAVCHGDQREGILPSFPPLLGIKRQLKDQQITDLIHHGKGRMPAFPKLQHEELSALLHFLGTDDLAAAAAGSGAGMQTAQVHSSGLADAGGQLFQQNCAFCHGRDAGGGESGPDLTRSKLVSADVGGDKISEVVHNGRPEKKMPAFNFSDQEMKSLVAFVHQQVAKAVTMKGNRRGVDVADLQTGNVAAGKEYFNGAGGCVKCHAVTGDLAGVATRYQGLQLEERMLYPRDVKSKVAVTLPNGKKLTGTLIYQDEFTIGMRTGDGTYRSWPAGSIKYVVDSPVDAHIELFSKYTDADIHNLMAYIQTLR